MFDNTEEDFATLFQQSMKGTGRLDPGQKVTSVVVSISGDLVYIDLGGKTEGVIAIEEFFDDEGNCQVKTGDAVDVFFVSVQGGMRKFTTLSRGVSTLHLADIENAYNGGLPVSGKVTSELKGGYEVYVGKARAFCPFSQIDLRGKREVETYVGETFPFKIVEFEENGSNIVLSRRVILEEENELKIQKLRESLAVDMEITCKVKSIHDFGVFVDMGGIDGFIPLSEIGWDRTKKAADVLSPGQEITVKVISINWEKNRISLSLKAMQPDPWLQVAEKYAVDSLIKGVVVRMTSFGVFVNLEPGIDGLIHISRLGAGRRVKHPNEVMEVGQWVEAYVKEVDADKKKIALTVDREVKPGEIELPSEGDFIEGAVDSVMPYGIFLKMNSGLSGLIPNSEMGTVKGTNHSRMFPPGTPMSAIVTKVDQATGKISLSRNMVGEDAEKRDFSHYQDMVKKQEEEYKGGLGSLGELLKEKFKDKI